MKTKNNRLARKVLALVMSMLIVLSVIPMASVSVSAAIPDITGTGTSDDPYLIYTATGLKDFAAKVTNDTLRINAKLMADIDLNPGFTVNYDLTKINNGNFYSGSGSPYLWTPIANYGGTFDGNGKTIKGLFIIKDSTSTDSYDRLGFIGSVMSGGTIKDLGFDNAIICRKKGTHLRTTASSSYYFGTVAASNSGQIERCWVNSVVYNGATVSNDKETYKATMNIGGIGGRSGGYYSNCYTTESSIVAMNCSVGNYLSLSYIGGIAGTDASGSTVGSCYAAGTVSVECTGDSSNMLYGGSLTTGKASSSYYASGRISGLDVTHLNDSMAGTGNAVSLSNMKGSNASSNMSALDFTNTWYTVSGSTPKLQSFRTVSVTVNGGDAATLKYYGDAVTGNKATFNAAYGKPLSESGYTLEMNSGYQLTNFTLSTGGTADVFADITPTAATTITINYTQNRTVTYRGAYTGTVSVENGGSVTLPKTTDSNISDYIFTVSGMEWDGTNITADVTVDVTLCTHSWSEWTWDALITHRRSCSNCGKTQTGNHTANNSEWGYTETAHYHPCTVCGGSGSTTISHTMAWNTTTKKYECATCGYYSKIDETAPTINGIEDSGVYYGDVSFTASDDNSFTVYDQGSPVVRNNDGSYTLVADNNAHTITATDEAGNSSTITVTVYKKYNVTFPSNPVGYSVTSEQGNAANHGGNYEFKVTLAPGYTATADFEVKVNGSTLSAIDEGSDGNRYFVYRVVNANADISISVEGVVDETAPVADVKISNNSIKSLLNTISFGLFFKQTQDVEITAADEGSGIKYVEYSIRTSRYDGSSYISDEWTQVNLIGGSATISIAPNTKGVVYVRAVDNDLNVTVVNSNGIVVYTDSVAVSTEISYTKLSNTDVTAQVTLNGNTVKEIKNGNDVIAPENYSVGTDEITFNADYLQSLAAGSYTLSVSYNPMGESYAAAQGNAAPTDSVIALEIKKRAGSITGISDISREYNGEAVSAPTFTNNAGTGAVTIEYKLSFLGEVFYSTIAPSVANTFDVRISVAADENYEATSASAGFTISQKSVTISGVEVADKDYNGNDVAEITNAGTLSANYDGEDLFISAGTAKFSDKNAGDDKTVTFSGFTLEGTSSNNYVLAAQPEDITASISKAQLTVDVAIKDKQYDGLNTAAFDGNPELVGVAIPSEDVVLSYGTPTFTSIEVQDNIPISFTAFSISGADIGNYELIQPSGITASIKSYIATKGTEYTVNSNDWLTEDFMVIAANGYSLSLTNTASGDWSGELRASDETANGSLEFYVKTAAGVISERITESYKIDKTAPTGSISIGDNSWNGFLNTITFGIFFNEVKSVNITTNTDLSGVASVEYAASNVGLSLDQVEQLSSWTEGNSVSVTLEDAKQFVYYARITDNAGNVSYLSTNGVEYDTTAPAISGITNGATYYTTQIVTVSDKNLDSLKLNDTDTSSPITLAGNTEATYKITAVDKAGTVTEYIVTMKPIASLSESIDSITESNVRASNKATVEAVKAATAAVDTANATAAEKAALTAISEKCELLLAKIAAVAAEITRVTDAVNGYNVDTVNSRYRSTLVTLVADIDALLTSENLDAAEITALGTVKTTANALIARIDAIGAEITRVSNAVAAYEVDTVKSSDKADIEQLITDIDALLATQNLTADARDGLGNYVKSDANALLVKIAAVAAEVTRVTDAVVAYDVDTVKSTDEADIEQLVADIDELLATDSLTDDEIAALGVVKTTANALLEKIAATAAEIARVTEAVAAYDVDTVKSSDKADIEQLVADIDALLEGDNMTDEETAALGEVRESAEGLLVKIASIAAEITRVTEAVAAYDVDTVKSSDKVDIEQLVADIDTLLATDSLTDDETAALGDTRESADGLLVKIASIAAEITRVTEAVAAYDVDTVKSSDKADIEQLVADIDVLLEGDNMTDDETVALGDVRESADGLLVKIASIAAEITRITDAVNSYDVDTVKSSDKADIEQLVADIDGLLATDSLTDDETAALGDTRESADGLLVKIASIAAEITRVTDAVAAYDLETVKSSDKANIEQLIADIDVLLATDSLTEDEITALRGVRTAAENLIAMIDGVAALIAQLTETISGYSVDTVKSTDKAVIEQTIADIETLIVTQNLTDDDTAALQSVTAEAGTLIEQLDEATAAYSDESISAVDGITKENVKLSDKDALEKAIAALEDAIDSYEGNYTDEELETLNTELETAKDALAAIRKVENVIDAITSLPSYDNMTADDIEAVREALKVFDELTDEEKAMIESSYEEQLNAAVEAAEAIESGDASPETGSSANTVWFMLMILVAGAVIIIAAARRKQQNAAR